MHAVSVAARPSRPWLLSPCVSRNCRQPTEIVSRQEGRIRPCLVCDWYHYETRKKVTSNDDYIFGDMALVSTVYDKHMEEELMTDRV
jgi:hypothetical protein